MAKSDQRNIYVAENKKKTRVNKLTDLCRASQFFLSRLSPLILSTTLARWSVTVVEVSVLFNDVLCAFPARLSCFYVLLSVMKSYNSHPSLGAIFSLFWSDYSRLTTTQLVFRSHPSKTYFEFFARPKLIKMIKSWRANFRGAHKLRQIGR